MTGELLREGKFLVDRIEDFFGSGDTMTDTGIREWYGHVEPSLERFKALISTSPGSVVPTEAVGKLKKRPVAFRVEVIPGNGAFEYFDYEDDARECADAASVEYEALYVRDGTPLNFDDASLPSPPREEIVEALREMIYETTHLSPCREDGSHWCRIAKDTLAKARLALSSIGGKP